MSKSKPLLSWVSGCLHVKALTPYSSSEGVVQRTPVPQDKISWTVPWPEYNPVKFTDKHVHGKEWADPDISKGGNHKLAFNVVDGKINRVSFQGEYKFDKNGLPLNPIGRTGLMERGKLGRWGPNHAADPIVTRWKRNASGQVVETNGKKVLQFVSICRRDNKQWAIPGGMVDAGENINVTLRREFNEEALAGFNPNERTELSAMINKFFSSGVLVYQGYVDDPRNTDNAWMETVAVNFHDADGTSVAKFPLQAGDDAGAVRWTDISSDLQLYASHKAFIEAVALHHKAHW